MMRPIASSQLVSISSPFWRTSGFFSLSPELFACQPKRSFGSTRPLLTRSTPSSAYADDAPIFDCDIQRVAVGVQYGGRLHPTVYLGFRDALLKELVYTHRPCFARTERRAFTPGLLYAVGHGNSFRRICLGSI